MVARVCKGENWNCCHSRWPPWKIHIKRCSSKLFQFGSENGNSFNFHPCTPLLPFHHFILLHLPPICKLLRRIPACISKQTPPACISLQMQTLPTAYCCKPLLSLGTPPACILLQTLSPAYRYKPHLWLVFYLMCWNIQCPVACCVCYMGCPLTSNVPWYAVFVTWDVLDIPYQLQTSDISLKWTPWRYTVVSQYKRHGTYRHLTEQNARGHTDISLYEQPGDIRTSHYMNSQGTYAHLTVQTWDIATNQWKRPIYIYR